MNGIHNIKGKTSVNILVLNYSNKLVTFNKGEYLGNLENIDEKENSHPHKNPDAYTTSSVTTKKIISEQVEPDTFEPPCHKLKPNIEANLEALLKEYESQFTRDETTISTTPLTKMSINTGNSEPVSQKPYPNAMKHYQCIKDEIQKLLTAKVIRGSRSIWSVSIRVIPKGDGGKCLVIDYQALNKVTGKFIWPMPKVEYIFSQLNVQSILHIGPFSRIPSHPFRWSVHHKDCLHLTIWEVWIHYKYPSDLHRLQHTFRNLWQEYWWISTLPLFIWMMSSFLAKQ